MKIIEYYHKECQIFYKNGISETSAWRVVCRVEDQLMKSELLSLPKIPSGSGV